MFFYFSKLVPNWVWDISRVHDESRVGLYCYFGGYFNLSSTDTRPYSQGLRTAFLHCEPTGGIWHEVLWRRALFSCCEHRRKEWMTLKHICPSSLMQWLCCYKKRNIFPVFLFEEMSQFPRFVTLTAIEHRTSSFSFFLNLLFKRLYCRLVSISQSLSSVSFIF